MSDSDEPVAPILRMRPVTMAVLLVMLSSWVLLVASAFRLKHMGEVRPSLIDFDIFHIVGRMYWQGTLETAYRFELFKAHQGVLSDGTAQMPWTYPPPFGLVAAGLALLPVWGAHLLFVSTTLAAYLLVLRRLAGEHFHGVFLGVLPLLCLNVLTGQNGLLTGALVGLFALLSLRRPGGGGVPLGLMIVKPHLALGLGVFLVLSRRWATLAVAVAAAAGAALLSTLAFGPGIWGAFLHGVEESGAFLEQGLYPLQRMTSIYAGLRSFGIDPRVAFGVHAAVALGALAMVQLAVAQGWRAERVLAVAMLATLLVSPYNYDYDLPILGVALALVLRTLGDPWSRRRFPLAFALTLFVGTYPLVVSLHFETEFVRSYLALAGEPYALAAFAYLGLAVLLFAMMWKEERTGVARARHPVLP